MSRKNTSKPCSADAEEARRAAFEGEVPELGQDFFDHARIRVGDRILREADGTLTRRGRPPHGARAKAQQSLRLSPEVIEHFRAGGPGWQARLDEGVWGAVAKAERKSAVAEGRAPYQAGRGEGRGEG